MTRANSSVAVTYTGRLSAGGYVGPSMTVLPGSRTVVTGPGGPAWDVRIGPERVSPRGRYVMVDYHAHGARGGAARWRRANPLREEE